MKHVQKFKNIKVIRKCLLFLKNNKIVKNYLSLHQLYKNLQNVENCQKSIFMFAKNIWKCWNFLLKKLLKKLKSNWCFQWMFSFFKYSCLQKICMLSKNIGVLKKYSELWKKILLKKIILSQKMFEHLKNHQFFKLFVFARNVHKFENNFHRSNKPCFSKKRIGKNGRFRNRVAILRQSAGPVRPLPAPLCGNLKLDAQSVL